MYQFLAGFYAGIGVSNLGASPFVGWKASLQFATVTQSAARLVGVNLIPIVAILLLERVRRASEDHTHTFPSN